ncbi:type II toxin-antitoxin system VapC family toxin [Haliscomenobacter sp.]|uniref:type II toxin-antitoxin system VapC family toxin n=1 Tax=Haliscomenobacter sp. TaxID=2717303 RepID=UPI003364F81D
MGQRYLLDTNICLYFLNQTLTEKGFKLVGTAIDNAEVALSVVTQMEVLGFNFPSPNEEQITNEFVSDLTVLPLSEAVVRQTISIRKKQKIKLPDAIIGATALVYGLTLITRNVSDFNSIEGLEVLNPFDL